MIAKLDEIEIHFKDLEAQISDPDIMKDMKKYKEIAQEHSHMQETVAEIQLYRKIRAEISDAKLLIENEKDAEMKEMAREELDGLEDSLKASEERLKALLIPKDPRDSKNIIMEIRAGTGGDEAALFVADLFRMYSRLAETRKWKVEVLSTNEINLGGFKEIVFSIGGKHVFGDLKYESGVHRVQRVPATESSGRVHTSAVTIAVLPEAEGTDIVIKTEDLKFDVYRSSGPGGQSVNTTDSAVRITHLPTGLVVTCQDEKSQIKNKAKAMRVLKARLYEAEDARLAKIRSDDRKSQVGSGDRSERIRTYNFPQNRLTDHRINLTLYKLDSIIEGNMDEVIEALQLSDREEYLQADK
ncbi:MAG: peptide chain release factor 1 [Spirochaetales bacterium]|nr:peptide chain release factor 1 [Spirochaetales bacterium]